MYDLKFYIEKERLYKIEKKLGNEERNDHIHSSCKFVVSRVKCFWFLFINANYLTLDRFILYLFFILVPILRDGFCVVFFVTLSCLLLGCA